MNILIITFQGDIAGSTSSISYLAKGLADRNHNVFVGCRRESLLFSLLEDSKVRLIPMTFSGRFDFKNMRQIRDAVSAHNIQVINAQSSLDRYTSVLARWFLGVKAKIVHTRRQVSKSVGGFFQNLIYVKGTDQIVAVSEGVKVSLVKGGIPEKHISVIYNGTPKEKYGSPDVKFSDELKAKYDIKDSDFVIGCVSRLKNQVQILEALRLIKFPVKVFFVGIEKKPEWDEIIDEYKDRHEIIFTGMVPSDKVLNYFPLFNIKILASIMEGLSQSLLEAMALGIPVIATNAAGNPELVEDEENGFLFEDGNISELADHILTLKEDFQLRERFIENGKKTALEKFNIDNTVSGFESLFEQLIMEKPTVR